MRQHRQLLLLIALLGLLVPAACGTATQRSATSEPQSTQVVEARADGIYTKLWGTPEQQEAAHYLDWQVVNQPMIDCMKGAGQRFTPTFRPLFDGYEINSTQSNGWMGKLDSAPSHRAAGTRPQPTYEPPSAAYDRALRKCSQNVNNYPIMQAGSPVGADAASADWHQLIDDINATLGPIEDYHACMRGRGVALDEHGDDRGAISLYRHLEVRRPTTPLTATSDETWSTYLAEEDAALRADRACRADQYRRGLDQLGAKLDQFEATHAEELRGAEAGWAAILADAEETGFKP